MAGGGFGGGSWGGGPWGGSAADFIADLDNLESISVSEGLTVYLPLRILSAIPLSLTVVELTFDHDLDPAYAPHLDPANYTILPALQVNSAAIGPTPNTIRLQVEHLAPTFYTVTVGSARAASSDLIDPAFRSASFAGPQVAPTFIAAGQGLRKVMLTFSQPMLQNAAFTNTANYLLIPIQKALEPLDFGYEFTEDFIGQGIPIPILSVVPQGNAPISHATLFLGEDLQRWGHYAVVVDTDVVTQTGVSLTPSSHVFQWNDMSAAVSVAPIVIPIDFFSGEVSGGLHGTPAGQVFFSPALTAAAPNSVIQVEEVSVCTRAFDSYSFPNPPDPQPFFLHGGGPISTLGSLGAVLWAPADRLGQALVEVHDARLDEATPPTDGLEAVVLKEPIDITRGGFLNDSRWGIYDGVAQTFTVLDNLTPVGPGGATYTLFPHDAAQVVDQASTVSDTNLSVQDTVGVVDAVGVEKTIILADTVGVEDSGAALTPPEFTIEFSPEFDVENAVVLADLVTVADTGEAMLAPEYTVEFSEEFE